MEYFNHESAIIDSGCIIGKGTKIWHFSHIMSNSTIGENCNIGQNVVVSPGVVLGNNVKIQNNVSLYTGVTCEDDVFLGPSCVFTNVINQEVLLIEEINIKKQLLGKERVLEQMLQLYVDMTLENMPLLVQELL